MGTSKAYVVNDLICELSSIILMPFKESREFFVVPIARIKFVCTKVSAYCHYPPSTQRPAGALGQVGLHSLSNNQHFVKQVSAYFKCVVYFYVTYLFFSLPC